MKTSALAILLSAAAALFSPPSSEAAVIGIVYPECCEAYDTAIKNFRMELARGGIAGGDAEIYEQKPSADPMSWTNAFRKFVGVDADLIVVLGDDMLDVACREKTKIPVLFGFVADPSRARCIDSEENPGGNVTGVTSRTPLFTLLEKAKQIIGLSTVGVFALAGDPVSASTLKEMHSLGGELGFRVVPLSFSSRADLVAAFEGAPKLDLLFLPNFAVGMGPMQAVSKAAEAKRVPTVSLRPVEGVSSVLLSLYPDSAEQGTLMGRMALQLLQGEPPGKMKVETPKKIEFEVNMGAARNLGLKVPMSILQSATKVNK